MDARSEGRSGSLHVLNNVALFQSETPLLILQIDAMKAVAKTHQDRSLSDFQVSLWYFSLGCVFPMEYCSFECQATSLSCGSLASQILPLTMQ